MDVKQSVTRRQALQLIGYGVGAAALAACTPGAVSSLAASAAPTPGATKGGAASASAAASSAASAVAKDYSGVTLKMLAQSGVTEQPAFTLFATEFQKLTGATIAFDWSPWETLGPKIQTALAAPGSVDMFLSDIEFSYPVWPKLVELSDRIASAGYDLAGTFPSNQKYGAGIDGNPDHRYGIPFTSSTPTVLYRIKPGVPVPATWDDFNAFLDQNTSGGKYGIAFSGIAAATVKSFLPRFRGYGGRLLKEDWTPTVNSDAGVQALDLLGKQMKYTPPGMLAWDDATAAAAFLNGDIAVLETWTAFIMDKIQDPAASKVVDGWTMGQLPGDPANHFTQHNAIIFNDSKSVDAAFDFLMYCASPDQSRRALIDFKSDTAYEKVWLEPATLDQQPWRKPFAAAIGGGIPFMRPYPGWLQPFLDLGDGVQASIAGKASPQAALDGVASKWTKTLATNKPDVPYVDEG